MRVAALFDIHGNLPALEAVLADVQRAGVDQFVVGGDVLPGPMPRESLARLAVLDRPARFIHGNGELAILAQIEAARTGTVTYWGTTSGAPLPESLRPAYRWTADQVQADYETVLSSWPKTVRLDIPMLGEVLFCHGTPRSETEIFTRQTPESILRPILDQSGAALIVCGHTHMQFDRMVGSTRVVNAGSVGEPFGEASASWLLLGPGVELRRTRYDVRAAADAISSSDYPLAEDFARGLLHPPSEAEMLQAFGRAEVK